MSAQLPPRTGQRIQAISVETALELVLQNVSMTEIEVCATRESIGRVLARDAIAPRNLPAFRNSAMDGYALHSFETTDASEIRPAHFRVIGTVMAGDAAWISPVPSISAVRVMTGAPVPLDADAVVRFEDLDINGDEIAMSRPVRPGEHIRDVGSDLAEGAVAVSAGTTLSWATNVLLYSIGIASIPVHRQPVVAILSTGDEIAAETGAPHSVPDSNGPMLREMVSGAGAKPRFLGIARDRRESLVNLIHAAKGADAIVISGGVSAGDRDEVRALLIERDAIVFSQVRMKPGRPFTFGLLDDLPIFALPGNPFAAAATFLQFVRPAIAGMRGRTIMEDDRRFAVVADPIANPGPRRLIVPVKLESRTGSLPIAKTVEGDSAGLARLAKADGLLVIPESIDLVNAGDACEFWPLSR